MAKFYTILIFLIFLLTPSCFSYAQVQNSDVVLVIDPSYPTRGENVSAVISSKSLNLDKAMLAWYINGVEMLRGIGKKTFSFITDKDKSESILSVVIDTVDGQTISKNITVSSGDVELLYESPSSYVPLFYKGKALNARQAEIKVSAIPNISNQSGKINQNNLSYSWIKNGTLQTSASGWGKNYFSFFPSYLDKENEIEVKVSDITGNLNAYKKIIIGSYEPRILFYENHPSYGIKLEQALQNNFKVNQTGISIIAEPYFFSPENFLVSNFDFKWFLGGDKITSLTKKNMISIKPTEGEAGSTSLRVLVENKDTIFQSSEKNINVSF